MIWIESKLDAPQESPLSAPPAVIVVVMPMTPERVGRELDSAEEEPLRITSLEHAFEFFKPTLDFRGRAGSENVEFRISLRFRSLEDFTPQMLVTCRGSRNDLADLKGYIESLRCTAHQWKQSSARRTWEDAEQRKKLVTVLGQALSSIQKTRSAARAMAELLNSVPPLDLGLQSAVEILAELDPPFSIDDTYDQTLAKIENWISQVEQTYGELLHQLFKAIRPIERSYRLLALYFSNSATGDATEAARNVTELFVFNSDFPISKKKTLVAIEDFIRRRNDNFNFNDDVFGVVVPGLLPDSVRNALEEITSRWGALLFSDTDAERGCEQVRCNLQRGGKYAFLQSPPAQGTYHVLTAGWLQLRCADRFEQEASEEACVFVPTSLLFATLLGQGERQPDAMAGWRQRIPNTCRIQPECDPSDLAPYCFTRHVVVPFTKEPGLLDYFAFGADDFGVQTDLRLTYINRVIRFIRRCLHWYLQPLAGAVLTRDFVIERIETPVEHLLDQLARQGTIAEFLLTIDKSFDKLQQGICEMSLTVRVLGVQQSFVITVDLPGFIQQTGDREMQPF